MRGAALVFGLLAGLLGAGAIALGNLASGLNLALSLGDDLLAKSILYGVLVVGLVGTGLILAWPKVGGAIMVLCALGWAAAGLVAGHGGLIFAALPITFAGAGGLVAMFARPRLDADDEADDDPQLQRDPRRPPRNDDFDDDRGPQPIRPRGPIGRSSAVRSEPGFDVEPPRTVPSRYRSEPADYPDETPDDRDYADEEDYIDADPALDDEGLQDPDVEYPTDNEEDDRQPRYRDGPRPARRGQDRWSLPDPQEQRPRRSPPRQDYIPERQPPAPLRREPLPPRGNMRPTRRQRDEEDDYYRPEDNYPAQRREPPRSRNAYRAIGYDEPEEADETRRGPLRSFFRIIIMLVFVVIVLGAAAAVYFAYPNLPSVLFGKGTKPVAETTSQTPATQSSTGTAAEASAPAPEAVPATETPPAPVAAAAGPVPLAGAGSTEAASTPDMSSPFDYCRVVDTIDTPDDRYTGPAIPAAVASALSFSSPPPANQVFWRCAGQAVYACNSKNGPACNLTPTVDMMLSYCAAHPDAKNLPAPNGTWSCNGKRPSIPRDQEWPVDARGFYPGAWSRVAPPAGG